jgi:hypothetical protein
MDRACSTNGEKRNAYRILVWHVARMGRRGMHVGYWCESQKERDH